MFITFYKFYATVSQKQAFIFASNELKENVKNSEIIEKIMEPVYFEKVINNEDIFLKENNEVYTGGGHTVLEFPTEEKAVIFTKEITKHIYENYNGIEVFAKTIPYSEEYDEKLKRNKNAGDNIKKLIEELEKKKSKRTSAFHQGSFGVEKIDSKTLNPIIEKCKKDEKNCDVEIKRWFKDDSKDLCNFNECFENAVGQDYKQVLEFDKLGGTKEISNFIAIVHIDGNSLGKRVSGVTQKFGHLSWKEYKEKLKKFSDSIDRDFKKAYIEMLKTVEKNMSNLKEVLKLENGNFPIRKLITAGDDICFVTEGRIGIECAAEFIKALSKFKNEVDKEGYSACAGVAIVHQKYPFFKAYELSEMLCSNAKKFGSELAKDNTNNGISAIDWHIEFGELKDTVSEIREKNYKTLDGNLLNLRPYVVDAPKNIDIEEIRKYSEFKKLILKILNNEAKYSRGKIKELRNALKQGETETKYFLKFNKIEDIVEDICFDGIEFIDGKINSKSLASESFIQLRKEKEKRSVLFDAVEIMDTYVELY